MSNYFAALDTEEEIEAASGQKKGGAKKEAKPSEPAKTSAPAAKPAKAAPAAPAPAASEDHTGADAAGATRSGGGGGGRGGRVPSDGRVGSKRVFDRHLSGTGRGKEVSKGGSGSRNWGSAEEEARAAAGETPVAPAAEGATPVEAPPAGDAPAAAAAAAEPEPEVEEPDNSKTFDDYQKELAAKRSGALFATAKADTSSLMKQFEGAGIKKVERKELDEDVAHFAGKVHGGSKEAHAEEEHEEANGNGNAADVQRKDLLNFRIGGAGDFHPREERGRGRGRGGGRGGFRREGGEGGEFRERHAEGPPSGEGRGEGRGERGRFRGGDRGGERGRGGGFRGGDRGRGGSFRGGERGSGRGGSSAPRGAPRAAGGAININDTNAFPTLG